MEHSQGKLAVVHIDGVAIGAGFKEDYSKNPILCFRMIFNTLTDKHQDYHISQINANTERAVECWNSHDKLKADRDALLGVCENFIDIFETSGIHTWNNNLDESIADIKEVLTKTKEKE